MANYSVRLYCRTGFDGVNIPDSEALLNQCVYKDFPSIDIRQDRRLPYIRVKGEWGSDPNSFSLSDVDYAKIGSVFYSAVTDMIADDVAEITLTCDAILSVGGIEKAVANIVGGMTSRFIPASDEMGFYEESDALLAPALPLTIKQEWTAPSDKQQTTYIESTIDLPRTYISRDASTCVSESGEKITWPTCVYITESTEYGMEDSTAFNSNPGTLLYNLNDTAIPTGTTIYPSANQGIQGGMAKARSLQVESGIISQFIVPNIYVKPTYNSATLLTEGEEPGARHATEHHVTKMTGQTGVWNTTLKYKYATYNFGFWNRIFTSEYTKYGLVTASGESCEFNAGDILSDLESPQIRYVGNPNKDGRPYFRFNRVNGSTDTGPFFFRSCVGGMPWKQVPLVYTSVSGSALNTLKYENSRRISDTNFSNVNEQLELQISQARESYALNSEQNVINTVTSAATSLGSFDITAPGAAIAGAIQAGVNGVLQQQRLDLGWKQSLESNDLSVANAAASYAATKASELSGLMVQNSIAVPTVTIPYSSDVIRDFYGNGVLAYHYEYQTEDLIRINKILSMYGYKHTKPIESQDFYNRKNFNYVECNGVQVTGYTRYFNELIAAQLGNGVRVWHVKPSRSYYEGTTTNPLK